MSVLTAAIKYANAGISVIPARGKKPSVGWESAQRKPASIAQIQYWDAHGLLQNVAVVCGKVSSGLVIIDCDGIEAIRLFKREFPDLADGTLAVTSGSRRGAHYWFFCNLPTPTVRAMGIPNVGNIELRSEGTYTIAPPSIHPDTNLPYVVRRSVKPMRIGTLQPVSAWIESLRKISTSAARNDPPWDTSGGTGHTSDQRAAGIKNRIAYGKAALESEIAALLQVKHGQNEAIYNACLKLGSHIRDGNISQHYAEMAIYNAARDMGYIARDGESHLWSTIRSGIDTGMGNSRDENSSRRT